MSIFYRFGEVAKGYEKILCILIMALNGDSVSRYVLIVYRVNYDKRGDSTPDYGRGQNTDLANSYP
jgi:hypothetical protein